MRPHCGRLSGRQSGCLWPIALVAGALLRVGLLVKGRSLALVFEAASRAACERLLAAAAKHL